MDRSLHGAFGKYASHKRTGGESRSCRLIEFSVFGHVRRHHALLEAILDQEFITTLISKSANILYCSWY